MQWQVQIEQFPIAGSFTISREVKTHATVTSVTLTRGSHSGSGESYPLKRYGDSAESVRDEIQTWLQQGHEWTRENLIRTLKPGPARHALDAAMWQLEAAEHGKSFADYFYTLHPDMPHRTHLPTAMTLSGDEPEVMGTRAMQYPDFKWIKVKLMGDGKDHARLTCIHIAAPRQPLIVDANEALNEKSLAALIPLFIANNVCLIEQPLPQGQDDILKIMQLPIPLAADESCHSLEDLDYLVGKYQVANIKLDKCGGLTHGMVMAQYARSLGLSVMVGCMVSTHLGITPAWFLAQLADYIDLDAPLLLEKDRDNSKLCYSSGQISLIE